MTIVNAPFYIHQHDEYGYYTGQSRVTTPRRGIPFRWSRVPLPEVPEGKFAQLNGDSWAVVDTKYTPPPPVPQSVTARQARLALQSIEKLDLIDPIIDAMPESDRAKARIEWEYALDVERNSPLVLAMAPAIGLTDAQLDDLFRYAATL